MTIGKKLTTMQKGIRERGFIGFFRYFFFQSDNNFIGRYVEIVRRNRVKIEGLTIRTDSSAVPRHHKSQLLQGRYERPERNAIKQYLDVTLPVVELGGSIGVVACMTNKMLKNPKAHIVVEANPNMAVTLHQNKALNHCEFDIVERAIAYGSEEISFYQMGFSSSIVPVSSHEMRVKTTTLSNIISERNWQRFSIVCDIEGAEVDLVANEMTILKNRVPLLIVELHDFIVGENRIQEMMSHLNSIGFEKLSQEKNVYVFKNNNLS